MMLYWLFAILACWASFAFGQEIETRKWKAIVMKLQYPPGCTCMRNSLAYSPDCPHHSHLV
jgi:hypothetical protein